MTTERQTKTPRQRAEESLAVADRLVTRLQAKLDAMRVEHASLEGEISAARKRRDYLAANPDLPQAGMDVPEPPNVGGA